MSDYDDGYDGYDDDVVRIDTAVGTYGTRDVEGLLDQIFNLVAQAKTVPLGSSVMVSREDTVALIDAAKRQLPVEIREARWALRDREELMAAERRKADQLMDQVRAEAARMVDKTEIVRQAHLVADKIIAEAEERGRALINEAEDYCDQKLGGMEVVLDRLLRTVRSGRERLRPTISAEIPREGAAPVADSFFDQDQY
jgi:hypothetical protein